MPAEDAPIGIFDSGFGGLTVARAVLDLMPNEDIIYFGDTQRAPYGPRPIAEVREFALQGLSELVAMGVKALVIACNSAASVALRDARERFEVPIVEVILPAARRAVRTTRNGKIGVISTQATAKSRSYDDALAASDVELFTQPCPRFVEFVEAGITSGPEVTAVAEEYRTPLRDEGIDTLILGCTHYPLLSGVIGYTMGEDVTLVSSADECGRSTYAVLHRNDLLHAIPRLPRRRFLTTGDPGQFEGLGRRLMGGFVEDVHQVGLSSQV